MEEAYTGEFERTLRMDQMQADINLKSTQTRGAEQDWRLDPQRVIIQAAIATAGVVGALAAILAYLIGKGGH